ELSRLGRAASLGGLSGALAHELSQPLAAILSDAQAAQRLLRRDPPDLAEVAAILIDIVAADERAAEVIDRLRSLLLDRRDAMPPLDLHVVLSDTLRLAETELGQRRVQVLIELTNDPPTVMGDPVQLSQVLLNLIANACDAMH